MNTFQIIKEKQK